MRRRLIDVAAAVTVTVLAAIGIAGPANAATREQKLAVLSSWTQTSVSSYNAWNAARLNRSAWADYRFDWSTDYCSNSPDNPLGFDFRFACYRHDFGYRNYKAMSIFPANKGRVDSAFYEDMKRICVTHSSVLRPACNSLAWTYYQAVSIFGSVQTRQADIERAEALLPVS